MKNNIEQTLSIIESWLDKKGFVLCKSSKRTIQDEVDFERKVVFLSLRSSPINQIYSILHECGHVILRTRKDYPIRFKDHFSANNADGNITIRATVEEIEEEILAWREGENLAKKLGIHIDTNSYYRYGFRWVMGYVTLASIGNENLLPIAKESTPKKQSPEKKSIDICRLLDNAHDSCYCKVIAKPEP